MRWATKRDWLRSSGQRTSTGRCPALACARSTFVYFSGARSMIALASPRIGGVER
jgi:hypothetical protein